VYDDTIYNFCARARFAGCSYLRHIILGLNTVRNIKKYFLFSYSFYIIYPFTDSGLESGKKLGDEYLMLGPTL
jgi:hypothetical protein